MSLGGSWGSRVGPRREVLKRGTPIPLMARPSVQHPLLPKLPAILASPPQVECWGVVGMDPFTLLHWVRDALGARCLVTHMVTNSKIA